MFSRRSLRLTTPVFGQERPSRFQPQRTIGGRAGTVRPEIDIPAFARMITSAVDGVVLHAALFGAEALAEQKSQLVNMVRTYLGHTDKAKGA